MGCANHRIRRSESEYFLIKAKNAKVFQKGKHAIRFPLWRERGTASRWLVVESRMLYVRTEESVLMFFL